LWVIFALLDPDPEYEYASGSTDPDPNGIRIRIRNPVTLTAEIEGFFSQELLRLTTTQRRDFVAM
jgi:hypothetical protein